MDEINVSATEARHNFSHWLNRVSIANDRVRVVRHGRLLAVLVSPKEYERLAGAPAAAPSHDADELWQMLKRANEARFCARCKQFVGSGKAEA